ncbi:Copine-8 [Porphyridium purpureum]|uniref:Copine-8 n=1 Tax=Porphyridium purpureum TaxID=35688 RepID=A0A5J4YQS5_PORPP|nr:Copine-8 [Porphyridium purpureum]|eukprot:POR3784..scf236_6
MATRKAYVEVSVAAYALPRHLLGVPDAFVVLFTKPLNAPDSEWKELGRTEVALADLNPNFVTKFKLFYVSDLERNREVLFNVYQYGMIIKKEEFVGFVRCALADILESPLCSVEFPLKNEYGELASRSGYMFVAAEVIEPLARAMPISIQFEINDSIIGGPAAKDAVYFIISRELKHTPGAWARVYRSKAIKASSKKARSFLFDLAQLTSEQLYANDPHRTLLIEMYHYSARKVHRTDSSDGKTMTRRTSSPLKGLLSRGTSADGAGAGGGTGQSASGAQRTHHFLICSIMLNPKGLEKMLAEGYSLQCDVEPGTALEQAPIAFGPDSVISSREIRWHFMIGPLVWGMSKGKHSSWGKNKHDKEKRMWRGSSLQNIDVDANGGIHLAKPPRPGGASASEGGRASRETPLQSPTSGLAEMRLSNRSEERTASDLPKPLTMDEISDEDEDDEEGGDAGAGVSGGAGLHEECEGVINKQAKRKEVYEDDEFGVIDEIVEEDTVDLTHLRQNASIRKVLLTRKPSKHVDD